MNGFLITRKDHCDFLQGLPVYDAGEILPCGDDVGVIIGAGSPYAEEMKRSWKYFRKDPEDLIKSFSDDDIYKFNMDGSTDEWNEVLYNYSGKINTWAVFGGRVFFLETECV